LICPKCASNNIKVLESRDTENGLVVRRRRFCEKCEHRFTTFERIENTNFIIIKKDQTREPYSREKLEKGIWISCGKRPVTQEKIDAMISRLEQKWSNDGKEISSVIIGSDVMKSLKEIDEIAYIRFSSVYKDFKDIETFKKELVNFLEK